MSTFKNRATPGVYITELNAFPNSIPGVQTAIPAFIGYTEQALIGGRPVSFKPIKINSLADYQAIFGGGFDPLHAFEAVTDPNPGPDQYDFAAQMWNTTTSVYETKYYNITPAAATTTPTSPNHDEHTDGEEKHETVEDDSDVAADPEMGMFNLYNSVRLFYANGGGTCYICSVGPYATGGTKTNVSITDLEKGLFAVGDQAGPTMLVIPDAVLLPPDSANAPLVSAPFSTLCKEMLAQCAQLQDRVAILDVYGSQTLSTTLATGETFDSRIDALVDNFHLAVGENFLNYGMAYFPFLVTSIIQAGEINYLSFTSAAAPSPSLDSILISEASSQNQDSTTTIQGPTVNNNKTFLKIKALIDSMAATTKPAAVTSLNQNLSTALPLLKLMEDIVAAKMSLLPASGAMAGLFTFNDASRGVWNAPANVVVNSVAAPNAKISAAMQGPINIPINGKAINVIRDFPGRGPVVWGARTLDGNSNDWRYVQIRRTLVYVETSIKAALNQFVFAANNGTTWVAVTAMVSGFLQNLWQQGGLMGAKPDEAFTVQCGLGSTMTGMDVLQGYMIVQITLQMIRPAEFIELTFKQKMEGVA